MRLQDCYKTRALRKNKKDPEKAKRSLNMAYERLDKASELHDKGFHEECVVASYSSMLMGARALLFTDGIVEKNHYCVILYLQEHYMAGIGPELISWLDTYRVERHQWFYGLDGISVEPEDSEDALDRANRFIDKISTLINGKE
jgi:uncharacterized protein (UPF0332 family)